MSFKRLFCSSETICNSFFLVWIITASHFAGGDAFAATPSNCLSDMEKQLADQINTYRNQNGLASVPFSKSLTLVAQWHVIDLYENHPNTGTDHGYACNMHSWSNQHPSLWNAVCYTADHRYASGIWDKPWEITGGVYFGNGYENAYWTSGTITATAILNGWKNSPPHNDMILENEIWAGSNWPAMGVGIYQGFAVLWFGDEVDPLGAAAVCSGGGGSGSSNISIVPLIKQLLLK